MLTLTALLLSLAAGGAIGDRPDAVAAVARRSGGGARAAGQGRLSVQGPSETSPLVAELNTLLDERESFGRAGAGPGR